MIPGQQLLAKKYAKAFYNVFASSVSDQEFIIMCQAAVFFENNRHLLFFLTLHTIPASEKIAALVGLFEKFDLQGPAYQKLITLLVQDRRAFLIKDVLDQLCLLYQEHKNISIFDITSSHELSDDDLAVIQEYLAKVTQRVIMYAYAIDKSLIAGIRAQSDTLLWEYSIRKNLKQIRLPIVR